VVSSAPGSIFAAGLIFHDRYRLDEVVASGGMAEVWQGRDLVLQRPVAVKLLHPHLAADAEIVERFRREAIAAASLSHPNIVPTFDTGSDNNATYIVLGLVEGPTLADLLRGRKLTALEAMAIGRQIADALDHAHQRHIVHRDIKPSNIMLVDNEQRVMVADFGIAKAVAEAADSSLTLPGFVLGTPSYVAPEQLNGTEAGPRTDVYALGVLLHEMVCGHASLDLPTQVNVEAQEQNHGETLCSDVPIPLDAIVAKATSSDPEQRYASAAALRDALHEGERDLRIREPEIGAPAPTHDDERDATLIPIDHANPTQQISATQAQQNPAEHPPAPAPSQHRRSATSQTINGARNHAHRRRVLTFSTFAAAILLAVGLGRYVGTLSSGDTSTTTTEADPVTISSASSFDPFGDRSENNNQARAVFDGDAVTTWSTETYASRQFGNLKQGVGIAIDLPEASKIGAVSITSPSSGWSGSLFVTNGSAESLTDWGTPVTALSDIDSGTAVFRTQGAEGKRALIWITDLGSANRVSIAEVEVLPE
jgi:serine/threonine protein kinase